MYPTLRRSPPLLAPARRIENHTIRGGISGHTMSAHHQPREQTFLNDPAAYPEFSLLVKRERVNHAVRFGLHRHRYLILLPVGCP